MREVLYIDFITQGGSTASVSLRDVKEGVTELEIKTLADLILEKDVFEPTRTGKFVSIKGARIVKTEVSEFELA